MIFFFFLLMKNWFIQSLNNHWIVSRMDENELAIKLNRKEELLHLARKSRAKWVLDAAGNKVSSINNNINNNNNNNNKPIVTNRSKLPSEEVIQQMLNLLSDITEDGSYVDVETIETGLQDYYPMDSSSLTTTTSSSSSTTVNGQDGSSLLSTDGKQDNYLEFLDKLRRPISFEIVRTIQQFVAKFETKSRELRNNSSNFRHNEDDYLEWAETIWKFLDHISQQIRQHSLWVHETDQQWFKTNESIERFVFTKLHSFIFNCDAEDIYLNQRIKERIISLGFLSPEHLDIKTLLQNTMSHNVNMNAGVSDHVKKTFEEPVNYLNEMNSAKCPYDMLNAIRKCSVSIATILKTNRRDGTLPGADEFLPMLILSIKFAEIQNIHSIIKYLQRYIHSSKLMSESGYLLTHFVSAVHFLENVDAKALTIEPGEFELAMERCKNASKAMNESSMKRHQSKVNSNDGSRNRSTSFGNSGKNSKSVDVDGMTDDELIQRMEAMLTSNPSKSMAAVNHNMEHIWNVYNRLP